MCTEGLPTIRVQITGWWKIDALVAEEVLAKAYLLAAERAHNEGDAAGISVDATLIVTIGPISLLPFTITVLGAKRRTIRTGIDAQSVLGKRIDNGFQAYATRAFKRLRVIDSLLRSRIFWVSSRFMPGSRSRTRLRHRS